MNKVLIELFIPALGKSYDVYIPLSSKIAQIKILLSKAIEDITFGDYIMHDVVLCDYYTGLEYDINAKVSELGILNGSKLMLI